MFFFFTCGTHTFSSPLKGAEHLTVQCQNCGNHSGRVLKRCLKPYHEVGCHICNFYQDLKYRPDVQAMMGQGGQAQMGGYAMSGGENGVKPGGYGPPPQGVPGQQYK